VDIKRAEEIINSKGVIEVTHNNTPVWIESIAMDSSKAHVKLLPDNHTLDVPVEELEEKS
jgi:H-type small acid-soluble spore protein